MTRCCRYNNKQLLKLLPPSRFTNVVALRKEKKHVRKRYLKCSVVLREEEGKLRKIKIYGGRKCFKWMGKFVSNN